MEKHTRHDYPAASPEAIAEMQKLLELAPRAEQILVREDAGVDDATAERFGY